VFHLSSFVCYNCLYLNVPKIDWGVAHMGHMWETAGSMGGIRVAWATSRVARVISGAAQACCWGARSQVLRTRALACSLCGHCPDASAGSDVRALVCLNPISQSSEFLDNSLCKHLPRSWISYKSIKLKIGS
jgi:hypothetical protein